MTDPTQIQQYEQRRQRLIGIGLMTVAVLLFAVLDATAKYLGGHLDTLQVVAMRFVTAFFVALIFSNPILRPGMLRTARPGLQLVRGLFLVSTTICNFFAFRYLQLDEALAILFATPFLVAAVAGPILGEWIGWRRWTAIGVGFAGVLVVIRPGLGGMQWAALISVGAAIFYAAYAIATRMAMRHESSETTLFYANLVGLLTMLPVLPFVWTTPSPLDFVMLVGVGALGTLGHFLLILAHRRTPASTLSPFMYTQLIWATALGYLVFNDVPNRWTLIGAGIVVASGLYLLYREQKVRGAVAPVAPR
ncbi:MAG: DMT family transporter [Alphaproteobacteria bacterium]|nr:DMT family transporter [Alphaproteobacteria bacterium]